MRILKPSAGARAPCHANKNSDKRDETLSDCSFAGDKIYANLAEDCEAHVPGGYRRVEVSKVEIDAASRQNKDLREFSAIEDAVGNEYAQFDSKSVDTCEENVVEKEMMGKAPSFKALFKAPQIVSSSEPATTQQEPPGWILSNSSVEEFLGRMQKWNAVELATDFEIFDIPKSEMNPNKID